MSRAFNGGTTADQITFSAGSAPAQQGPITVAVLAKATSTTGWTGNLVKGKAGASNSWALLTSNNSGAKLFIENDFGNGVSGLTTSWAWYCFTKASGSNLPRFHVFPIGGAWTHTNGSANVGNNFGPIDTIYVGADGSGSAGNTWRGSIAVVAAWSSVLTDLQIEAAMTTNASDVFAASPNWMIRLNQTSTATSVSDDTAGGGNQTALSGTTVDADDPPGFNYALTASQTVAPTGIAVPVGLGQPAAVNAMDTVAPTGLNKTVALGTPTASQSLAIATSGIAIPVALGTPTISMIAGTVAPTGISIPIVLGTPTVSGQPYVQQLTTGSWWELETIMSGDRALKRFWDTVQPLACPNDGEPLKRSVDGILYCQYDNWRPDNQVPTRRRPANLGRDWAGLRGVQHAAAMDAPINQLLLACPNDGEPLSIGANGQRFCRWDGWMPPV